MVGEIVIMHKSELRVSTFNIFKDLGYNEHRFIKRIISSNKNEFEEFGFLPLERQKPIIGSKGGRPDESYLLNENQFILLVMFCKNNPKTISLKVKITKQFSDMKKALMLTRTNQLNASWIEARNSGKISRREETDIIKEFVEYATGRGSKNAKMYYSNITRMENKALFIIAQKFKNVRDLLDGQQLATLSTCDQLVAKTLRDGMKEGLSYKEIYQRAKKDVESLVGLLGQSYVPNQKKLEGK